VSGSGGGGPGMAGTEAALICPVRSRGVVELATARDRRVRVWCDALLLSS
jgi:hypothetical protein